jgi:predicted TIM-barrel fold metal-dependent hydrolase
MKKKKIHRKLLLWLSGVLLLLSLFSSGCIVKKLGGAFSHQPDELQGNISSGAQQLIDQAFSGLDPQQLMDYHAHILGIGTGDNGTFVNPDMQTWWHLRTHLKFLVYLSASGIENMEDADREYVNRLVGLIRSMPGHGKVCIVGFDKNHNPDGTVNAEKTSFYIPNAYVVKLAEAYPDVFVPAVSIHPYRADAVTELEKWAQRGVRFVKWLPNSMSIDPENPRIDPYYRKMNAYNMVLITHTGEEQAVEAEEDQIFGNPLKLRRPLSFGVRVSMAHFGSLGDCADLDYPGSENKPCADLCLRMLEEKQYEGLLFGEISAIVQYNRLPGALTALLAKPGLHHRLINGSDYPLPGVNFLYRTKDLAAGGFITDQERIYLNEIYDYNPLLFDFVMKRTVKHPITKEPFAASVFTRNQALEMDWKQQNEFDGE